MVRTSPVCLDTHVIAWFAGGQAEKVSPKAKALIEQATTLVVSPMVVLELQLLHEIGRVREPALDLLRRWQDAVSLRVAADGFERVGTAALDERWTRDPFDRLIVAHARLMDAVLITRDRRIAANYGGARW